MCMLAIPVSPDSLRIGKVGGVALLDADGGKRKKEERNGLLEWAHGMEYLRTKYNKAEGQD